MQRQLKLQAQASRIAVLKHFSLETYIRSMQPVFGVAMETGARYILGLVRRQHMNSDSVNQYEASVGLPMQVQMSLKCDITFILGVRSQ